jgi:hypothetical protein
MQNIFEALELFAAGVTAASTGALLAVVYIVFSPALQEQEGVEGDSRQRPL